MREQTQCSASESEEESFVRSTEAGGGVTIPNRKSRPRHALVAGRDAGLTHTTTARDLLSSPTMLALALLCHLPLVARGWGGGDNDGSTSIYSASERRNEWMYSASKLNIEYVGCVWGTVEGGEEYHEDFGCREDESEDGTYYWYQMASCRRAQVVYNVYSGGSCGSSSFKESYVTKTGLSEFIDTMNTYDAYSPLSNVDAEDYPMCEEDGNGYYLSVGCDGNGGFVVNKFSDEYCLQYYGEDENYDLSDINYALQNMQSCYDAYDSSSGNSVYQSALAYLLSYSEPCTSIDSPLCTDSQELGSSSGGFHHKNKHSASGASIANKLKYVLGALLLVASVTMFMGILFTNRRRRRAMMHRRFRQSASRSRSSRSRRGHSSRSKSRTRSSSRKRRESRGDRDREGGISGGVFT